MVSTVCLYAYTPLPRCSFASSGDCPAPPQLAAQEDPQPSEPLNSRNHFVAEYFLEEARRVERSVFFSNVQAAFVFTTNEPSEGVCSNECNFTTGACRSNSMDTELMLTEDLISKYENTSSRLYNESDSNSLTVTIWYNNQVTLLNILLFPHRLLCCYCRHIIPLLLL